MPERAEYLALWQRAPQWREGGLDEDEKARRARGEDVPAEQRYPGDYAGRVLSLVPRAWKFTRGDLAEPSRDVTLLRLTEAERLAIERQESKLVVDRNGQIVLRPVELDDLLGAVSAAVRGLLPQVPDTVLMHQFRHSQDPLLRRVIHDRLRKLRPCIVHTGVGLYEVGAGKTYSTIQSALDALWSDQGSALFTSSQYIRIFTGTFAETITVPSGLRPDTGGGFALWIEGDPDTQIARSAIVLTGAGGSNILTSIGPDQIALRKLTFTMANFTNAAVVLQSSIGTPKIINCQFTSAALNKVAVFAETSLQLIDTDFDCPGITSVNIVQPGTGGCDLVRRCSFKAGASARAIFASYSTTHFGDGFDIEACTFRVGSTALDVRMATPWVKVRNCTFYECGTGLLLAESFADVEFSNCIVKDTAANVFSFPTTPAETSTVTGPVVKLRNNIFEGHTSGKFAKLGAAEVAHAAFIAYNQVDSDDDLDGADPLFVDADNDNFALEAGSPARRTGRGALVDSGINDVAFALENPDRGAWSSGDATGLGGVGGFDVIRQALDAKLDAFQSSDVAYENANYSPSIGTLYLRPTFLPGEPTQGDLGDEGRNRLVGVYQIDVFAPEGDGVKTAEQKANGLVDEFKRGTVIGTTSATVRINRVWRQPGRAEPGWYVIPVRVMWFSYSENG
jgi:hypothetical protein